jgi:predicted DNA-binding transcriptional regulator AlpA
MPKWKFDLILDREPTEDADFDRIFEAGLDDSTPGNDRLHMTREAPTLLDAVWSAVAQVRKAGFEVTEISDGDDDYVTIKQIADRIGRTVQSIDQLAHGDRGPGGFPRSVSTGVRVYPWASVRSWLQTHGLPAGNDEQQPTAVHDQLRIANALLQLARYAEHRNCDQAHRDGWSFARTIVQQLPQLAA